MWQRPAGPGVVPLWAHSVLIRVLGGEANPICKGRYSFGGGVTRLYPSYVSCPTSVARAAGHVPGEATCSPWDTQPRGRSRTQMQCILTTGNTCWRETFSYSFAFKRQGAFFSISKRGSDRIFSGCVVVTPGHTRIYLICCFWTMRLFLVSLF